MHICPKTLGEHGCGECLRNRTYEKRVWCHRMDLESRLHAHNSFLTLTYDDAHLPAGSTLVKRDLQLWFKKFRKTLWQLYKIRIRYFIVGEYGDETQRPHYHAALFGVGPEFQDIVLSTWQMGHVMLAELNIQTIRYITGYVTKKMGVRDIHDGREPEFRLMSKGLGRGFTPNIVDALDCAEGASLLQDDVPSSLQLSGSLAPLGRYLQSKLRKEAIYAKDSSAKLAQLLGAEALYNAKKQIAKRDKKMSTLYENYCNSSMSKKMTFHEYLFQLNIQRNRNSESQFKLKTKGTI